MTPDIQKLLKFYRSPLGNLARELVRKPILDFAGNVEGKRVLGLGFATPYLRFALEPAERLLAFMPARQGASSWPREGPSVTTLCDPLEMPLTDSSIDLVVMVHGLEHAADSEELMRELWRIAAPNAQLIIVVPRRRGLWSTRDNTPFGFGNPFSRGQLERLLNAHSFEAERCRDCLYLPPSQNQISLNAVSFFERFGRLLGPTLSGVIVLSARKKSFPVVPRRIRAGTFVRLPELVPQTAFENINIDL